MQQQQLGTGGFSLGGLGGSLGQTGGLGGLGQTGGFGGLGQTGGLGQSGGLGQTGGLGGLGQSGGLGQTGGLGGLGQSGGLGQTGGLGGLGQTGLGGLGQTGGLGGLGQTGGLGGLGQTGGLGGLGQTGGLGGLGQTGGLGGLGQTGGLGGLGQTGLGGLGQTGLGGLGQTGGLGGLGQTGGLGGLGQTGGLGGLGQTGGLGGLGQTGGLGQSGGLGGLGQTGGLGGLGQTGGLGGLGQTGGLGGLGQTGGLGGLGQTGGLGGLGQTGGLGGLGQTGGLGGLGQTGGLGGLGQTGGLGGLGQTGGLGGLGLGQQHQQKFGGLVGLGGGQQNVGLGTGLGGISLGGGTGLGLGGALTGGQKSNFGQMQTVPQAQVMLNSLQAPAVFCDDRDVTLMKFNHLQAYCGTGKGLASYMGQPQLVDFTPENPFCRFKAICYCRLPTSRNEDGLVALQFNKKDTDILSSQDTISKKLQECLPDPRIMQVVVSGVRPLPDDHSEMTIHILEKSAMGGSRRLLAVDVFMYLQNLGQNPNWKSIRDDLSNMYPLTGMNDESLKVYLQNPPAGINPRLWEQGKLDNPDPQKYIPVVVTGFPSLLRRVKQQEQETRQHQRRLEMIDSDLQDLQRSHALTVATVTECKTKLLDLGHRVLRVMVMQEILRRGGYSIQPDEEQLRVRLENIQAELDAPLKFKGCLNELMSVLRMQLLVPGARAEGKYAIDPHVFEDIKQHLQQQQGALLQLVKFIKEDTEDLSCVEEGFSQAQ